AERTMFYGKGDVYVFRTYANPLKGLKQIPESNFTEKHNTIFGMNAKVALKGEQLLTSFTEGDNSLVVATDSMKNFIQRHAASYEGATLEGFLQYVCEAFLAKYSHLDAVRLEAKEYAFDDIQVGTDKGVVTSDLVFRKSRNEYVTATVEVARTASGTEVVEQASGIADIQLIKVSGSSFYGYIIDEYTTLAEATDRPLYIFLNIGWAYENQDDAKGDNPANYVAAEQVRDIAASVFHTLDNKSIQHLIYHIGLTILDRFPQLTEVNFGTNNRTWDTVVEGTDGFKGAVFTEPRPPFGFQGFSVHQEDLAREKASANSEYVAL
nr:Chain A, Uricase [Metabacillus fastidiosus]4R8X_B Chain B, Uricase [Metabacillus fastidiosus]4R8X_C Chain C, Uricase [Metabacillus fastidiosus]4R8X_D Chain D, Uricase [Metabacillus fastidiosus]